MSLRHHWQRLALAAALAVSTSLLATSGFADEKATDLPVKRVVMFSSGVAFFEHSGDVEGDAKVDLKFNVDDVNDLLKSMVLQDHGGGRVSTVSYGSKDPITRTLRTFTIDLTQNPTLADLLSQIRGEKIEIDAPEKISGTILGVEKRKKAVGDGKVVEVEFLNLLTDEGLRSVSLENVGRIKLSNPKLDAELRQALLVLAMSKSTDKKSVSLSFLGQGKRAVTVGYIQEAPVWKTSYRLVLEDKEAPLLQGWAIVENTTETDWDNVNLSLVSGRPISFVMDLYQPLYIDRPWVKPELYASLTPRTYDQDLAGAEREFKAAARDSNRANSLGAITKADGESLQRQRFAAPGAAFGGQADEAAKSLKDMQQTVQSVAQAGDVGEMFRYNIATPVKVQRSGSAMLPIVNESVSGEKVSIYNPSTHVKHPLNGLRLKNTTDLHLMQGPITVYDDGAYAGDAQIQDLPPKSERLISYAMDLDTEVAPSDKGQPTNLVSCKLVKGTLHTVHKHSRAKQYIVKNGGKAAKKVLVEQPLDAAWTLIEPKEAAEKTRDLYRFAVAAEPGKPVTLDVKEERTSHEQIAVNNLNDPQIRVYLGSSAVSADVKKALEEVIKRKAAIDEIVRSRQEMERQIAIVGQEQERIRGNMAQTPKESELFRRYLTKFSEQEDNVEALRAKVTSSIEQETKQRKALDDYLIGLDLA
ncbi:MAG TPA: hypothetical protein VL096_21640 [Pirellulaceae bacterium]|nr:hypothetical protein [Pirellulaceae bacterium]